MIAIIDYKAGNAPSVLHAVEHIGFSAKLVKNKEELKGATHIILPGVGSAKATMDSLKEIDILDALAEAVKKNKTPFLGICVGMQILFEYSEEGDVDCLGWLEGRVKKFDFALTRVPQMGWNKVWDDHYYFVNSYYAVPKNASDIWGTADYGIKFCASVKRGNIWGTQFHAEKSGAAGLALLKEFLC